MGIEERIGEAIAAYDGDDLDRAERCFREVLQQDPSNEDAGCCDTYLGAITYNRGDYPEACRYLDTALHRGLQPALRASANFFMGMALEAQGRAQESLPYLTTALAIADGTPGALDLDTYLDAAFRCGKRQYGLGQFLAALESLQRAMSASRVVSEKHQGQMAEIHHWIAYTLIALQRYADAIPQLEEALRFGGFFEGETRATLEFVLAKTLISVGRASEAAPLLRRLVPKEENGQSPLPRSYWAAAYWGLGWTHWSAEEYAAARPWLEKAVATADSQMLKDEEIENALADCLVEFERPQEALRFAKEGYQRNPDAPMRAVNLAKALYAMNDLRQASAVLNAVRTEGLTAYQGERLLAHKCWVFGRLGNRDGYDECYKALKALNPHSKSLNREDARRLLPPTEMRWPQAK